MRIKFLIFFFSLVILALPFKISSYFLSSVVINEVAWMGTETSVNDEWIELYNNSGSQINLDGWKLIAEDGTPEIDLKGEIPPKGFFLLERTDDETLPTIKADLIYKGSLSNKGEYLKLIDSEGKLIDEVNCASGWFEGDNKTKRTMERKNPSVSGSTPENWQTSENPGGTPKAENSLVGFQPPEEVPLEEKLEPEPQEKVEEKLGLVLYPSNIFINEILPDPKGIRDAEGEYIEILNKNNIEVDLSEWQITDTAGRQTCYTFPKGTIIGPKSFLVIYRPKTKITLNNDGDSLKLVQPNGNIIDSVNYENAIKGESYNRTSSGWVWSTTLTPRKENIITQPEISEIKKNKSSIEKTEKIKEEGGQKISLEKLTSAKIGEEIPKSSNSLIVFLIAVSIAIASAVIVLILKKRLTEEEFEVEETEYKL